MPRISSFFKIKENIKNKRIIKTKKDALLCFIILGLQIATLILGVLMNGFGSPSIFEQRTQLYTTANKISQTYSMIYHKTDNNLSYLDYHISKIEGSENMKRAGCKIFFNNGVNEQNNKSPFRLIVNENIIDSPIVFLGNKNYSIKEYFNLTEIIGDFSLNSSSEIVISSFFAETLKKEFFISDFSNIIGMKIKNEIDQEYYIIKGIFDETATFLSKFYSQNLIIGHFEKFSKIDVNPRLGFITGKEYLENLYFIYRISTYIDSPNYGRTTVVSSTGNDFDKKGNEALTKLIYNSTAVETNFVVKIFTWFFVITSLVLLFYFVHRLFDNKKCVRIIAIIFLLNNLLIYFICQIINNNSLTASIPLLNIASATFNFCYALIFLFLCSILDYVYINNKNKKIKLLSYCNIDI